jgi:hypothetical protein
MKRFLMSALAMAVFVAGPAVGARKTGGHKAKRAVKKKAKGARAASNEAKAPPPAIQPAAPEPPPPAPAPAPVASQQAPEPIVSADSIKLEQLKKDNELLLAQVRELENPSSSDADGKLQQKYDDLANAMSYSRSKCRGISDSLIKQAADGMGVSMVSSIVGTVGSATAVAGNIVQRVGNKDEDDKRKACAEAIAKNTEETDQCHTPATQWATHKRNYDDADGLKTLNGSDCLSKAQKKCDGAQFPYTLIENMLKGVAIIGSDKVTYKEKEFYISTDTDGARFILVGDGKDLRTLYIVDGKLTPDKPAPAGAAQNEIPEGTEAGPPADEEPGPGDAANDANGTQDGAEAEKLYHYAWAAYRRTFLSAAEDGGEKKPIDKNKVGRIMTIAGNAVGTAGGAVTTVFSAIAVAKMKDLIAQVKACQGSFSSDPAAQ